MTDWTQSLSLLACPACQFDPNNPIVQAASSAIGFMVLIVIGVLSAFLAFIWKLAKADRIQRQELERH